MLRFAGSAENISSLEPKGIGDISSFFKLYAEGEFLYCLISWSIAHIGGGKLKRLLKPENVQDYVYIQPCGIFSNSKKLGDFLERHLERMDDEFRWIISTGELELATKKNEHFTIFGMRMDEGCHYDGFKFETLPAPGLPIVCNNRVIGRVPEDVSLCEAHYDDSNI